MLWKCRTQYASIFGKLSSGHRTGKGQFSFQSQRKAMRKNAQTTAQLHSSHTLAKQCSKLSKPGFNSMWSMNFQMFKLVLEKAEEPEIKLTKSVGSSKKQEIFRNIYTSALLTMPKPLLCVSKQMLENSAVATRLENVNFHSNPKERQCQRMFKQPHNCTHLKH